MGFGWTLDDVGPIQSRHTLARNPVVVLFVHVPKCAGTTVRPLFHNGGWHQLHWSLTCRPTGVWHSHRLLKAIHTALTLNHSHIFAEWHQELNFSFLPELETHVRAMRPNLTYHAFTILRPPEELLVSNAAFWTPTRPVNVTVLTHPEYLLFDPHLLNLSSTLPPPLPRGDRGDDDRARQRGGHAGQHYGDVGQRGGDVGQRGGDVGQRDGHAECEDNAALCEETALYEATTTLVSNATGRPRYDTFDKLRLAVKRGEARVNEAAISRAHAALAAAATWRAQAAAATASANGSCAPLVRRAIARLAPLHTILFLEDNDTFPILQAVGARFDLSFRVALPNAGPLGKTAGSNPKYVAPYRTPAAVEMLHSENACSRQAYARVRSSRRAAKMRAEARQAPTLWPARWPGDADDLLY